MKYRLISNKIRCRSCGDILESVSRHDFKTCSCGKCGVDGGHDYDRRIFSAEKPEDAFEELSTWQAEDGRIVTSYEVYHSS